MYWANNLMFEVIHDLDRWMEGRTDRCKGCDSDINQFWGKNPRITLFLEINGTTFLLTFKDYKHIS